MSDLLETIDDGVATLTLNRPERMNAFSKEIMDGLLAGLPRLAGDPSVGVIVLTGAGRAFCAGGDVKRMAADEKPPSEAEATANLRARIARHADSARHAASAVPLRKHDRMCGHHPACAPSVRARRASTSRTSPAASPPWPA